MVSVTAGLLVGLFGLGSVQAGTDGLDNWNEMFVEAAQEVRLSKTAERGLRRFVDTPGMSDTNDRSKSGGEANPLLQIDDPCIKEAIVMRTKMVGVEQAERDIAKWQKKLDNKTMTELQFWTEVAECKDYCTRILIDAMNCYTDAGARRFRGLILFDTGVASYQPTTRGDRASNWKSHPNRDTLRKTVNTLKADPKKHVLLEGRASRVGNDEANFRLSGHRADSVRNELLSAGIPAHRIHYRWIGEGEPYFRPWLVDKYQVRNLFDNYGIQTTNQSVTVYIYTPISG